MIQGIPQLNYVIAGEKGNYKLTQRLGNGSISVVFKAEREQDQQIFAVKLVSSLTFEGQRQNRYQANELEITKKIMGIQSNNLINIHEIIEDDKDNCYIVMEFCDNCDLYSFSLTFLINWQTAIEFGYQIACGIDDLHRFNITHRDLKPENIFVRSFYNEDTQKVEYNLKIGDFGLSKEGEIYKSKVGTPNYMCPEQFLEGDKSKDTDIWAFGAILFELIEKIQYFNSGTLHEIYNQIRQFKAYDRTRLNQIEDQNILDRINNLIEKCLDLQPKNRITSTFLVQELKQIMLDIQNIPQQKRHISLRIATSEYLQKQPQYSSIYYVLSEEESAQIEKEKKIIVPFFNHQISICLS